ncbi:MAG: prephenate dehydratase [Flavobacteriales bacterium]|nr:prephenate dehydratase [Flavobacteriales bacterium]
MEKILTIAIQGIKGSYHHVAVEKYFGREADFVECATFKEVPQAIEDGVADFGVMAIENSIAGSLLQNHKLLGLYGQKIIGEVYVQINHCLLANKGVRIEDLTEVESHPMAILQCENFFQQYPEIRLLESNDTARSARMVATKKMKTTGAIASELCARLFGLEILGRNIQTMTNNYTRFFVVGHANEQIPKDADKASIRFVSKHESGSLARILSVFAMHGLNLTKIQSVAIMERPWEYAFYADVMFPSLPTFMSAMEVVSHQTEELEIQGIYKHNVD